MKTQRREALKKMVASLLGISVAGIATEAKSIAGDKTVSNASSIGNAALLAAGKRYNNLIFVSGKGAHVEPFEIKAHTEIVLKELEDDLIKSGSSMEKVLKTTVYLNDIADYQGMNEVYRGRFGNNPPVRTTVAVAKGGVPGNSIVEIDCIAYV